ncbi:DNA-3-methyladenine glycosylase [Streptomyces sp900116325]|uniref:DNA-3-methyladenine glycosylase n=1 Tax=Streptomyces sp. 900116325 TaxID=3154295 RepID=A0ABV2U2X2_9ACTN
MSEPCQISPPDYVRVHRRTATSAHTAMKGHLSPTRALTRTRALVQAAISSRKRRFSARHDRELAKGPARLATALDIDKALNGTDVIAHPGASLSVLHGTPPPCDQVRNGPRTGVGGDGALHPWRFWIDGDPTVSPYRPHAPGRRAT